MAEERKEEGKEKEKCTCARLNAIGRLVMSSSFHEASRKTKDTPLNRARLRGSVSIFFLGELIFTRARLVLSARPINILHKFRKLCNKYIIHTKL